MEFILKEKLFKKYSEEELKNILPPKIFTQLIENNSILPPLSLLARNINLEKINYRVEEFKEDYKKYSDFVEVETVFKILMQGISLKEFMNNNVYSILKKGFFYNSSAFPKEIIKEYIKINYDISNFRLEFYKNHIELYGAKEELEDFRNKFKLKEEVYYEKYKKSWHLAFKGLLAEYIRIHEKKDTN